MIYCLPTVTDFLLHFWLGGFEVITMLEFRQKGHYFTYMILRINLFLVLPKYLTHQIC
jgi:hypothetical protein